jgi:hypothetical protein
MILGNDINKLADFIMSLLAREGGTLAGSFWGKSNAPPLCMVFKTG